MGTQVHKTDKPSPVVLAAAYVQLLDRMQKERDDMFALTVVLKRQRDEARKWAKVWKGAAKVQRSRANRPRGNFLFARFAEFIRNH